MLPSLPSRFHNRLTTGRGVSPSAALPRRRLRTPYISISSVEQIFVESILGPYPGVNYRLVNKRARERASERRACRVERTCFLGTSHRCCCPSCFMEPTLVGSLNSGIISAARSEERVYRGTAVQIVTRTRTHVHVSAYAVNPHSLSFSLSLSLCPSLACRFSSAAISPQCNARTPCSQLHASCSDRLYCIYNIPQRRLLSIPAITSRPAYDLVNSR